MVEKKKEHKKVSFSEEDACSLLQRYEPTTVLTLLQEVEHHADLEIDWNELVKKTSTGITNSREYQMLWRHLAYRDDLLDKFEDGAQPLDGESDIECELEAFPAPSNEVLTEAEACVKVMIDSGIQSESNVNTGATIEAPLAINIPTGHLSRGTLENLQPSSSMQGMNIIIPVTVQKFPLPAVPSVENLEANGSTGGNNISLKRKRKWSEEEDRQLMAAVNKWGESNWAVIINKGEYDWGGRQASHLSQRWTTLRKKNTSLSIGKNTTEPKLTEAQMAARHAMSMALDMPVKGLKPNGIPGHVSTKPVQSNTTVEKSDGNNRRGHLSKQGSIMALSSGVKSQPICKKTLKSNLGPDSAARATAVAAGARITSPSDTVSLVKAAEAKGAVHVVGISGSSTKLPMPASGAAQSETPADQHSNHTGQTTAPLSSHTTTASVPASSLRSSPKASSPVVETTSTQVEVLKSEHKNEDVAFADELSLKQEVNNLQGREVQEPGCAPKEQVQGDELSRPQDAESEVIEENKQTIFISEAECRSQVGESCSLNLEKNNNLASADKSVLAGKVETNTNDSKMLSPINSSDQNMNEKCVSLPSIALDKCNPKPDVPVNVEVAEEL